MKFCTKYNRPPSPVSPSGDVSLTDASYLNETNIDIIMKRYAQGDTSAVRSIGVFADVSALGDFQHCMDVVKESREAFEALPADIRDRFGHDPVALVKFLSDSSNDEEAVKLGLKSYRVKEKSLTEQIVEGVTAAAAKPVSSTASVAS